MFLDAILSKLWKAIMPSNLTDSVAPADVVSRSIPAEPTSAILTAVQKEFTMQLAWGKKVNQDFINKVFSICDQFGWQRDPMASYLMSCMAFESGETFDCKVCNAAGSGAVGLIQFMPATAADLGTSVSALKVMSQTQQLSYVQMYFRPYYKRIQTLSDMYMAILMPKYVGAPDNTVVFNMGTVAYKQNAGLDANKDGQITKAEISAIVTNKYKKGMTEAYVLTV